MTTLENMKQSLKKEAQQNSIMLKGSEIEENINFYKKKYGCKIIYNGTIGLFSQQVRSLIATYEDPKKKYAKFILDYWAEPEKGAVYESDFAINEDPLSYWCDHYKTIKSLTKNFLDENTGKLKAGVQNSESTIIELNKTLATSNIKTVIDEAINKCVSKLKEERIHHQCIDASRALEEITHIKKNLTKGESVGYIFTNCEIDSVSHYDVFVISSEQIIIPIQYYNEASLDLCNLLESKFPQTSYTEINLLDENNETLEIDIHPQADSISCGTLGLCYLKTLLKNNSNELENNCLTFPHVTKNENTGEKQLSYNFFPPPKVLQYSQSSRYNKALLAMLNDKDQAKFEHNGKTHKVETIKGMLASAIRYCQQNSNAQGLESCKKTLNKFNEFRTLWLKCFKESENKRAKMDVSGKNIFLAYKAHRFFNRAKNRAPKKSYGPPPSKTLLNNLN